MRWLHLTICNQYDTNNFIDYFIRTTEKVIRLSREKKTDFAFREWGFEQRVSFMFGHVGKVGASTTNNEIEKKESRLLIEL